MKKTFFIMFLLLTLSISAIAYTASAATEYGYQPIVGIPGINSNALSTEGYVNALYKLSITVACLLALYKIIFGGVKWALSDVVTDKGEAKKDIKGALLGLLIVLSAVLVLNTINPNLTQLNIFGEGAPSLDAIEEAQQGADTPFGSAADARYMSGAEMQRFVDNCNGVIATRYIRINPREQIGSIPIVGCYADPTTMVITPGGVYDPSLYPPGSESIFEQKCNEQDGMYEPSSFLVAAICREGITLPTTMVIGTTVSLLSASGEQIQTTIAYFDSECPKVRGRRRHDLVTQTLTCEADPDLE
jgi:hypothetical protein